MERSSGYMSHGDNSKQALFKLIELGIKQIWMCLKELYMIATTLFLFNLKKF